MTDKEDKRPIRLKAPTLAEVQAKIAFFERTYRMSSEEFAGSGELIPEDAAMDWDFALEQRRVLEDL